MMDMKGSEGIQRHLALTAMSKNDLRRIVYILESHAFVLRTEIGKITRGADSMIASNSV